MAGASATVAASVLDYELVGLSEELHKNAVGWLGSPPQSAQARSNFLFTAKEKVEGSLRALGYYRPDITLTIARTEPEWQLRIEVTPGDPVRIVSTLYGMNRLEKLVIYLGIINAIHQIDIGFHKNPETRIHNKYGDQKSDKAVDKGLFQDHCKNQTGQYA